MKRRLLAILVLSWVLPSRAAPSDQGLAKTLTDQYQDKILVLRHSYKSRSQEYDFTGKLVGKPDEGPWTFYGRIQIKKIDLTAERLQLQGNRVPYKFDAQGRLVPLQDKERVKVTIRLEKPLTSVDQAATILSSVFAVTQEDVINAAPPYWRLFLAKQLAEASEGSQVQPARSIDFGGGAGAEKIFHLGPDVTAPKPLSTPEPSFSEEARKQTFQGVVGLNVIVDSTGHVSHVSIVHPLGMGLDEEAVRTISTWRFRPAMHKGQPVAIALYIEVDFHLYDR